MSRKTSTATAISRYSRRRLRIGLIRSIEIESRLAHHESLRAGLVAATIGMPVIMSGRLRIPTNHLPFKQQTTVQAAAPPSTANSPTHATVVNAVSVTISL
jgi:hypothetical protein